MANPQAENGHTDIANEILESLYKITISPLEWRVLLFILRKTYGWHKKVDRISLSQFAKGIGIDRRIAHRTIKKLSSKQMIAVIQTDDSQILSYEFEKDYSKWKLSSKQMTLSKLSSKQMTKLSSKQSPTKENEKKILYTQEFQTFYQAFPKKKARKDAAKAWLRLDPDPSLIASIMTALEKQKASEDWKKENGKYIPFPATWLNGRRWEDEIPEVKSSW